MYGNEANILLQFFDFGGSLSQFYLFIPPSVTTPQRSRYRCSNSKELYGNVAYQKMDANSSLCSQAVTHPSTNYSSQYQLVPSEITPTVYHFRN